MNRFICRAKILIGIDNLYAEMKDSKRVFVVCDPFIVETNKTACIVEVFDKLGIEYAIYSNITPDPSIDLVVEGIKALTEAKPDTIIGFGGGSAINACKAIMYIAQKRAYRKAEVYSDTDYQRNGFGGYGLFCYYGYCKIRQISAC